MIAIIFLGIMAVLLCVVSIKYSNDMRIQWNSVASFMAFMLVVALLRIAIFSFARDIGYNMNLGSQLRSVSMWRFALVWWEDLFFVVPLILINKYKGQGAFFYTIAILSSLLFASGHIYQGWIAAGITALYPFFVSYKFSLRYGVGTIMLCHIIYDFITIYIVKFVDYLI